MEILEAFDATGCTHSAAVLAGVDPKTVRRYVAARDEGRPVDGTVERPKIIDPFLASRASVGAGTVVTGPSTCHSYLSSTMVIRPAARSSRSLG